jgi:hypothetical protein
MKIVHLNNIDCPFVFGSLGGQKLEVEIYDEKNNKLSNLDSLSFTWSLVNQSINDFFQFDD